MREIIKKDLMDQLEINGTIGEFYNDLVNDYMSLWDVKNELIKDIEKNGVSIPYKNGANQYGQKKNDSVAELQRTNNQMIKLLDFMGLRPVKNDSQDYSDEEM